MGCGQSSVGTPYDTRQAGYNNTEHTGVKGPYSDTIQTRKTVTDDGRQKQADNRQKHDPPPRKQTPPPHKGAQRSSEQTPPPIAPTRPLTKPSQTKPNVAVLRAEHTETQAGNKQRKQNVYGVIKEAKYDFRQQPEDTETPFSKPPDITPFVDSEFGAKVAIPGVRVEWKRPKEFRDAPVLFSEGTTRYDIGQGEAGTCWFLAMVAMLAEKPQLFERVVPKDAWDQEGGYFFCNFWRFGEWETVYIDDFLPIVDGTELWGAMSADDRNEMWPALLEKAFARFHGSYKAVYGGDSGESFLALTGGCSEFIDFDDENYLKGEPNKTLALHQRLKNAIANGDSMLTADVPKKFDGQHGLVGEHVYSLTDAITVPTKQGKSADLVRIRNPHGNTEWKGAWSDGSKEWSTIDEGSVPHANKDDGEFWISLLDFVKYFSGLTINSMVPDFDKDGCTDSLNHLTTIFGDWVGETAAGFDYRINNPRYAFQITNEGTGDDDLVPVVLQICQKMKHRNSKTYSIRVDLFKILYEKQGNEQLCVVELLGEETGEYNPELQMTNRYSVEPGHYVAIPSCYDAGQEKEFLIRTYTPAPLNNVRELGRSFVMMEAPNFEPPGKEVIRFTETLFGKWQQDYNAGGQVSESTYNINPHLQFEIPNKGQEEQLVNFTLIQEPGDETFTIGIRVFEMDDGYQIPEAEETEHQDYLDSHYDSCPQSIDGEQGAFIMDSYADVAYKLRPGRYFVLLHADDATQEKQFALVMRATCNINPRPHRFE